MTKTLVLQIVEKVGWTFVQAFLLAFLAMSELGWTAAEAGIAAGVTAVLTLAMSSVTAAVIPVGLPFYTDLMLRILRSGAAAFLAFLLVEPGAVLAGETWQGALGAAGMAVLVALKGGAARFIGNPNSAAILPRGADVIDVPWTPGGGPGDAPDWPVPQH